MKYFFLSLLFLGAIKINAQAENVPAGHEVYRFLKNLSVEGIIKNYDDFVLPLSKKQVVDYLQEAKSKSDKLSGAEKGFLDKMLVKFDYSLNDSNKMITVLDGFPGETFSNILADKQKHLYHYQDSIVNFNIDPVADYEFIYSSKYKDNSSLINYGGYLSGSYDDWFGFYLKGTIGIQLRNRNVAAFDERIVQNYTFNKDAEKKYFDDTEGYGVFRKDIFSLEIGRERVLFGNGYTEKLLLSFNPPKFDFIKLNIKYKKFSYNFIHGWLVHPEEKVYVDLFKTNVRTKASKYFAISRLGFIPNPHLSLGVSQIIIYSDRPFELAYLNPFLFWESAQRSLNDLDNSLLCFDAKYLITNGIEASSSFIFDDINFDLWKKGKWNDKHNRIAIQIGSMIANPILFKNTSLKLEFILLRPYIFSHYGLTRNSLTYENNGYFLGVPLDPNSIELSAEWNWLITEKLNLSLIYKHIMHGQNEYDPTGKLIVNHGGNIFETFNSSDNKTAKLLDGILETTNILNFELNYEFTNGFYFNIAAEYNNISSKSFKDNYLNLFGSLKLNFN